MVMSDTVLYDGCIVKFDGNVEPCVVYRVVDATVVNETFNGKLSPHVKIEVIGLVPVELLRKAVQHHKNMYALDKALHMESRTN